MKQLQLLLYLLGSFETYVFKLGGGGEVEGGGYCKMTQNVTVGRGGYSSLTRDNY